MAFPLGNFIFTLTDWGQRATWDSFYPYYRLPCVALSCKGIQKILVHTMQRLCYLNYLLKCQNSQINATEQW